MMTIIDEVTTLDIDKIRIDGDTQMRVGYDPDALRDYRDIWDDLARQKDGLLKMPPIVVYFDGDEYWLADGFHRLKAYKEFLKSPSPAASPRTITAEVLPGSRRDAILYAAGANATHGLRRTNADKWRAVETLLVDEEWGTWSDREIARQCHVSPTFVGSVRGKLGSTDRPQYAPPPLPVSVHDGQMDSERTVERGGKTYTMKTENIGSTASEYQPIWMLEEAVRAYVRVWAREQRPKPGVSMEERQREELNGLRKMNVHHDRWHDLVGHLDSSEWRKRDLLQALANVAQQILQQEQAAEAQDVRPPKNTSILKGVTRVQDATPYDLAAAGYTIKPWGEYWRWRLTLPNGDEENGMGAETAEEAIKWAYQHRELLRRQGKLPATTESDTERAVQTEPKPEYATVDELIAILRAWLDHAGHVDAQAQIEALAHYGVTSTADVDVHNEIVRWIHDHCDAWTGRDAQTAYEQLMASLRAQVEPAPVQKVPEFPSAAVNGVQGGGADVEPDPQTDTVTIVLPRAVAESLAVAVGLGALSMHVEAGQRDAIKAALREALNMVTA